MRELPVVTGVAPVCTCLLLVEVSGFKSQGNKDRASEKGVSACALKGWHWILLDLQGGAGPQWGVCVQKSLLRWPVTRPCFLPQFPSL